MAFCKNRVLCVLTFTMILLLDLKLIACYEKTLRKIVRNQSKMMQRPFSEHQDMVLGKSSQRHPQVVFPGNAQMKVMYHKTQWPKMSTFLSLMEANRGKVAYSKAIVAKGEKNMLSNELRLTRHATNVTTALQTSTDNILFQDSNMFINDSISLSNSIDSYQHKTTVVSKFFPPVEESSAKNNDHINEYKENVIMPYNNAENINHVPQLSKFFPSIDENDDLKNADLKPILRDDTIIIPFNEAPTKDNKPLLVKGIYTASVDKGFKKAESVNAHVEMSKLSENKVNPDADQVDGLLAEVSDTNSLYNYNTTSTHQTCKVIPELNANIDAQAVFTELDIEPQWMTKKHYWNQIFNSRYESLMRNPKWPPLKVILIPRTHVDTIWRKSFDQYHNNTVNRILSNVVKKLQYYHNLTFSWNEVSHLSQWWKTVPHKTQTVFRRLIKSGRLEITTGGWVEPDEATSHIFGLIHQLMEGHQWLKYNLNYSPNVGWLTNSVTHSPTMPYLLSASGISKYVFTNLHYSWEHYLAGFQISDFIWQQSWDKVDATSTYLNDALKKIGNDRYPKHAVLAHYMQFNSAGLKSCGPKPEICLNEFDFAKPDKNLDINVYNIKEKSELLLEQYSKTGTLTPHNVVMAPIGGAYRYESQAEFDYQYNNYQKLAEFINVNREIYKATVEFGTPKKYFDTIIENHKTYSTLKGDFQNFADIHAGKPSYWTGFFTSRPLFKILLRRLQSTLRTTEILFSFAVSLNAFSAYNTSEIVELLTKARETVARLMDRNAVSGTLGVRALRYAHKQILLTAKDCWFIQEVSASLLSSKPKQNTPYLQKYVYRDGEFISVFRTVSPGDQIYIFNALSHGRTEVVELVTRYPNIRIVDHNKKDVTIQINPVWRYNADNIIKISRRFFKINFAIVVPPMTLELFKIKETYDATQNAATLYCLSCVIDDVANNNTAFPFIIQPIKEGDIQLESYKHRLIFDELTGFLKTVVEKETNTEKSLILDFGAFRSSDSGGMFIFDTNFHKPIHDILMPYKIGTKSKIVLIVSGQVATQLTTVYGRLLKHSVKIFNLLNNPLSHAIYVESKIDYEVSPKNRELELFMSIQSDISNGYPPRIYTDNNGFQYTARNLNISRRIESNMYPITTMAYIQDNRSRLTFITDHAQGVTALQEGQIVAMLDRRVLFNDGRGTNEGLADSSATYHRHIIVLENFNDSARKAFTSQNRVILPSLSAIHLAEYLNYLLDIFIINKSQGDLCHYAFLPLIKTSYPCDVSVINYRIDTNRDTLQYTAPNMALIVLHRHQFSCEINHSMHHYCSGESNFSLDNILRGAKAIYMTNLGGTHKGTHVRSFTEVNFAPSEILTLRVYF